MLIDQGSGIEPMTPVGQKILAQTTFHCDLITTGNQEAIWQLSFFDKSFLSSNRSILFYNPNSMLYWNCYGQQVVNTIEYFLIKFGNKIHTFNLPSLFLGLECTQPATFSCVHLMQVRMQSVGDGPLVERVGGAFLCQITKVSWFDH